MNTAITLIKREWLEHKTGFGWGPVAVLGTLIVLTLLVLALAGSTRGTIQVSSQSDSRGNSSEDVQITLGDRENVAEDGENVAEDGEEFVLSERLYGMLDYADWSDAELTEQIDRLRTFVARPFEYFFLLVAVFVLLGSLHDDRRDRTVLFWKSMPVSDTETVLSKLVHVAWVAPAVTIAAILAAQVFFLLVLSIGGEGSFWRMWSHSGLIMELIELVVGYLIQGLWLLPIFGWLLLVSVTATRMPFLWALLVPFAIGLLEQVILRSSILGDGIASHLQFAALPAAADFDDGSLRAAVHLSDQLALVATADMWIGIVIGAGFVAAATYMRRRNNDI